MGIKFYINHDVEYYRDIFVELGCPDRYAEFLAKGHLGIEHLTKFDNDIKNLMLQGYPYVTAKSMSEEEGVWKTWG